MTWLVRRVFKHLSCAYVGSEMNCSGALRCRGFNGCCWEVVLTANVNDELMETGWHWPRKKNDQVLGREQRVDLRVGWAGPCWSILYMPGLQRAGMLRRCDDSEQYPHQAHLGLNAVSFQDLIHLLLRTRPAPLLTSSTIYSGSCCDAAGLRLRG